MLTFKGHDLLEIDAKTVTVVHGILVNSETLKLTDSNRSVTNAISVCEIRFGEVTGFVRRSYALQRRW